MPAPLRAHSRLWDFSRPYVVGIINLTPDSFYAPSRTADVVSRVEAMFAAGADWVDLGAEASNPSATPIGVSEESRRLLPALEAVMARNLGPISVDTSAPPIIQAALDMGVGMINDIRALRREGALEVLANHPRAHDVGVCLMHMLGLDPSRMQSRIDYPNDNVEQAVHQFLVKRLQACSQAGLAPEQLILDPGIGFGKTFYHNWALLAALPQLATLGHSLFVGLSRKRFLGGEAEQRLIPSMVGHTLALQQGAHWLRVHDVAETVQVIQTLEAAKSSMPRWSSR